MSTLEDEIPVSEGYFVEFKDFSGGLSSKELATTFCAFANSEGGVVYVGVTDKRQIRGIMVTPTILDQIQNTAREYCSPPVPLELTEIKIKTGKSVLRINVEKSPRLHSLINGSSYIRVGTQDKRILGDELLRLAETKSQISFEDHELSVGLEELDLGALEEYYQARRRVSTISPSLTPEELLLKIGLAVERKDKIYLRAGAFILFGKSESEVLLQRDFTFVKYEHNGGMYRFREDIRSPAAETIRRLIELIRPYNIKNVILEGIQRRDEISYPEEALREGLLNALAHRDYRLSGLKNECRLYPERIEIISAGGLPSAVSVETLGERHYSRNPKIMHALLIMGFVEELGQGIKLMRGSLKRNGNPPPQFHVIEDQVKVTFKSPISQQLAKNDLEGLLNKFFDTHTSATRQQLETVLGKGSTTTKTILHRLVQDGILEKVGKGPRVNYKRVSKISFR